MDEKRVKGNKGDRDPNEIKKQGNTIKHQKVGKSGDCEEEYILAKRNKSTDQNRKNITKHRRILIRKGNICNKKTNVYRKVKERNN